jgi:hypothetical protein
LQGLWQQGRGRSASFIFELSEAAQQSTEWQTARMR